MIVMSSLNALSVAMILVLASLGLGIIYGQMNVLNLAHGEFIMLGAYAAVIADILNLPPIAGIIFAPIFAATIGIIVERSLIKPLYARPIDTLLVTWGLSIVLKQLIQLIFGAKQRSVDALITGNLSIFGTKYPTYRVFIIAITIVLVALVFFIFFKTSLGLKMRMVIQNRDQASAMGVNVGAVDMFAFALGSGLAGIAGAIMTPLTFINPQVGMPYLANSFIVVIVGGVSSLPGLAASGTVVGIMKNVIDFFARNVFLTNIIVLLLAILIIRIRPHGLFYRERK